MANPNGPSGNWTLTFEDTFAGTALDTTKWIIGTGTVNNVQCYAANVIVNNGLTLQLANSNSGAEIYTQTAYNLPVGSVAEARIFFPGPGGTPGTSIYNWPAWWVSGPNWPNAGEIDIAEGLGTLTVNYHGPGSSSYNTGTVSGNWSNSWHTYTVRRNANSFDIWYDGVLARSNQPTADNGQPQNMILNVGAANTAAYGSASYVQVSYVRQWKPTPVPNVSVDFTNSVCTTDPLGAGLVVSEFGGNPVPIVGNAAWQAKLNSLAPGHIRCSVAYYGGNPGYGAGGSSRTHGTATALINAIKGTGAIPLVSFNGDTADNNFNPADGGSLVNYFNGGSGTPSSSGTLTQTGGNTGQQFQNAAAGPYLFQLNEWNSTQAYSCNYSYNAGTGVTAMSVVSSSISVPTSGAPGSYSSMVSGNHAVGSPNYASPVSTQFPIQNSAVTPGTVTTSVSGSVPGTGAWDFAYDIWFSATPRPTGGVGNNGSGLEMMIWLNHLGGIQPAGSPQAAVTIAGTSWTPWVHANGPISYVRNTPVNSVTNLDLQPFIADAISRGLMTSAWYLIDVECGFEIWTGGAGLAITNFSCTNGGAGSTGGRNGGPVKYWSIGNEPGNGAPYTSGSGQGSASAALAAMLAADPTIVVGAPAAFHWDSAFLSWAASNLSGLGALSYHAYDGQDTDDGSGAAFPNGRQIYNHIKTNIPAMKPGIMYGIEEMNWHASYSGQTQFTDWHNTCFLADNIGQALSAGGHATVYSDSNGALGMLNDGGGQGQIGAAGTPQAAYWALGIWTGMAGQFKRWGTHMCSATTTFSLGTVTPYASDSGKIVIINKDGANAYALNIGVTLPGGATSGTYKIWATNQASPSSAITQAASGAFSGGVISYTIPAGTAISVDVTSSGSSPVTLTNNFEGGTNGTTLTAGNTGAASGNAFDAVSITNGAAAFSSTQKAHGSLSAVLSTTSAGGIASFDWNGSFGTQVTSYGRAYVYLTAAPAADDTIIKFLDSTGTNFGGGIMATASGLLAVQNNAFGVTLGPALPTGQWLRIEWAVTAGAAGAASLAVNYYLLDSITSSGSITDTTGGYGVSGGIGEVSYGWNTSHPSQPTLYIDDVGISNAGLLGPVVSTLTRAAALSGTGTLTAGGAVTGAGLLSNNFEGGTPGTTISNANSGGTSGNAFDVVTVVAGGVAQFSSAQATHGSLSGQFSTGSTSGVAICQWSSSSVGTQTTLYGRVYCYLTANPASDDNIVTFFGGSSAFGGGLMIANSGQLRIQNAGFGEVGGGPTVPLNQWFRLEWKIVCGSAGSASATLNYYSTADVTSPTNVLTDTAGAYGSGGSINQVQFGWSGGHTSQSTIYLDNIGLSTTGYLGPVTTLTPSSAAMSGAGTLTAGSGFGFAPVPAMSGSGTLSATWGITAGRALAMSGSGTLSAGGVIQGAAALSGSGTLGIAQVTPKVQTLQDAFLADDLSQLWSRTAGTVSVSGGRCAIQCDSSYSSDIQSTMDYDLTGSYVLAQVAPYAPGGNTETGLQFSTDSTPNNGLVIEILNGNIGAYQIAGGSKTASAYIPYDATAHAWWRIREQGGTAYFDTAPDGVTWASLWSVAYSLDVTRGSVVVFTGIVSGTATGTTYVANVNYRAGAGSFPGILPGVVGLAPAAPVIPYPAQFTGNAGGSGTSWTVPVTTVRGNTLVVHIVAWGTPAPVISVTDSTYSSEPPPASPAIPGSAVPGKFAPGRISGSGDGPANEWVIESATPVYNSSQGSWGVSAVAYCIGALPVTSITVSFGTAVWGEIGIGEWANVPLGAQVIAAANDTQATGVTTFTTPQLTVPSGSVLAVAHSAYSSPAAVSSPFTLASFGGDHNGAYAVAPWSGTFAATFSGGASGDVPNSVMLAIMPPQQTYGFKFGERMGATPAVQAGMPGSTLPVGYQGGPSGAAKIAPLSQGNGWEIYAVSGTDYTTVLAQIPSSMLVSFQFVRMLDDIGSGTVVLSMDDPWWHSVTLPGGLPTTALLDQECLWQVYKDGVCRFEFLGETVTEQLADQSEQRIATITGPGTLAVLKWAMMAPPGFPNIVLKLDGLLDSFDEVNADGKGVVDPNIWTTISPASHVYTTPIGTLYNYPQGAGYALSSLYPSGSLTLVASPATTFLGASPYDATDTLISANVTPIGVSANQADSTTAAKYGANLNGSELTQFYIQSNKNQQFYVLFGLSASAFYAQIHDRSGTYTKILPFYNATNHAYWMITEQGGGGGGAGTFYWWTSPDGENWTKQWTALHHWDATNCTFFVTATYSADSKVSMQLANLNSNVTTPSYQGEIYLTTPMMGIWLDQFGKAQARGTIPFVTSRLTGVADSYGRAWTDSQNIQTVNGTDLYSFLQSATSVVNADYVMDPGFQLRVGQPATGQVSLGVDRAAYLIFRDGHDSVSRQRIRARDQIVTVIGGENADGHEISAASNTFAAQWGKREGWFQTSVQVDPVSMAYATAAALAENETEILSHTLTIAPNLPGRTVFDDFDVGDWVGLERPDFSAVDDIRVVGIAVQVDGNGNETHELTVNSYIQWIAEQLSYLANKLGGQFVNTLGATPVARSKYGTGQVPTYFTPAATLAGLADVAGGSGASTKSAAPLVYNAATGQYQQAGTTDPVSGQNMPAAVSVPGGGTVIIDGNTTTVLDSTGGVRTITGHQPDGSITTADYNAPAPQAPDNPGVGGAVNGLAVSWDGLLSGTAPLADFQYVQVHLGLSAVFVPSSLTLMGTLHTAGTLAINNLSPGTTYWAKLVAVNTSGVPSAPTAGVSGTAEGVSADSITGKLPASVLGNSAGSWALNPNPFFNAGDLSGWTSSGAALTATSVVPGLAPGNASWVAVLTSTVAGGAMDGSTAPFPVTAGQPYAMTAWVYNTGASDTSVQIGFNWAGGTATYSVPPGVWVPLTTVQIAPPGAVSAYQVLQLVSSGVTVNVSAAVAAGQIQGGLIAAATVTAQQISAGIILAGVVNGTTIEGAQFIAFGTSGEVLVYAGTPAIGNLVGSWSAAAGNDSAVTGGAGNSFPAGLMVGTPGSSQVQLNPQANRPFNLTTAVAGVVTAMAQFNSGDSTDIVPGILATLNLGAGPAAKQTLVASSPFGTNPGAAMLLESANDGGTDSAIVTFGTVSSPDGGTTVVFTPIMLLTSWAMVLYSGAVSQVVVTISTPGSGTIPIPGGVSVGKGEAWGDSGGSAGGGSSDILDPGGGAGAGEYSCEPTIALTGGGNVSYTVGPGGAAGIGTSAGSGAGSSLSNGLGTIVFANGGGGGLLGLGGTGGPGGTGSLNSIHFSGGSGGGTGGVSGGSGGGGGGGSGGASSAGRTGSSTSTSTGLNGAGGAVPVAGGGSGGSGGRGNASGAGTAGSPGQVPGGGPGGGGNGGNGLAGTPGQVRLTYLTGTPSVGFVLNYGAAFTDQYGNAIPAGAMQTLNGFTGQLAVSPGADFSLYTVTQATQQQFSKLWPVSGGNAAVGTVYRLTAKGYGTWGATQQYLQLVGTISGANVTEGGGNGRIAAAAFTASTAFRWKAVFLVEVNAAGSGGTVIPTLEYSAVAAAPNILPGSTAVNSVTSVSGPTGTSAAVATDSAFTIGIGALWGATTGAPTITCVSSHFERLGP